MSAQERNANHTVHRLRAIRKGRSDDLKRLVIAAAVAIFAQHIAAAQTLTRNNLHPKPNLTKTGNFNLNVAPPPQPPPPANEFALSVSPAAVILKEGDQTDSPVIVTVSFGSSFTGAVQLSVAGLPEMAEETGLDPKTVTGMPGQSVSANLTLATKGSTKIGIYQVMIKGQSGALNKSATLQFAVNPATVDFFSQGTVLFAKDDLPKPSVAVQAIDADFSIISIHVRATLPTSSSTPGAGASIFTVPNANLRAQLLDPFGGILNLAAGKEWNEIFKTSNLSADIRGAGKIIEVPEDPAKATTEAYTASAAGTAGGNIRFVVIGSAARGSLAVLTLAGSYFGQGIAKSSVANRFTTPLRQFTNNASGGFVFSVPDLHFYITAGYRWSNDKQVGKQFVFSISPNK